MVTVNTPVETSCETLAMLLFSPPPLTIEPALLAVFMAAAIVEDETVWVALPGIFTVTVSPAYDCPDIMTQDSATKASLLNMIHCFLRFRSYNQQTD